MERLFFFWHKKIDEVVAHRVKLELKCHGQNFMAQYDHLDVVFGGDHGARRFRAVGQLIFISKNNGNVPTSSVTLQVGHVDAPKDTYEVLEETIARELNEGLQRIVNKFLVVHFVCNMILLLHLQMKRPRKNTIIIGLPLKSDLYIWRLGFLCNNSGKTQYEPNLVQLVHVVKASMKCSRA